ncbi:16S rRNA (guanine(527)-N(7))-methyltransferase RsmG [Granulibacter bethesdensis]|uniref:Ribosomal RNA small subunit methyltransferase G n=1 Tax=Granulibacter bethesdensis (strain ATCC BAA-1260 / CGDNIH1) TaxID=391165 RepID=RSMG_GRABC|nr:RecName: Full=Ribosomal RNA small subunit methyltransferase G; AltName: Full=16S rRNA 7-methylguanosine methyltransferase; Short=16S rRNA m7G methyltransferase [Granulibacter bethesdensis CGDNIH1]ABI60908.1 Methyltransferase gidB [Granulibacter bethesdensis CGDNIH1]APH50669.1 Methyltransferase gidB [Granulibacter bethesdensis]APH63363.1 Methyltransferase gidB [Granulibacter bethesdensis]
MFHVKQPLINCQIIRTLLPAGSGVSRETGEKLALYESLLTRWTRTVNLVSRNDVEHIRDRHILDSLQLLPLLEPLPGPLIDIGSGGGLPGLVLAIATGRETHLVEADQRKAAFLREAARATESNVTVHACRIEQCNIAPAPVLTARALAPLNVLLGYALRLLSKNGVALFMKGKTAEQELTEAATEWHMRVQLSPSRTHPEASILRIDEISRV